MRMIKYRKSEIIFFCCYWVLILWQMLRGVAFETTIFTDAVNKVLGAVLILGFGLQICVTSGTVLQWIKKLFIIVIALIIAWTSNIMTIILVVVGVISAKNIEFKKVVRFSKRWCEVILILTVTFSLIGIIPNIVYRTAGSFSNQYCLGFTYFTMGPSIILYQIVMDMYLNKKKNFLQLFLDLIIFVVMFLVAGVTLNFVLGILLILLYIILVKFEMINIQAVRFQRISVVILVGLAIGSIILAVSFNTNNFFMKALNNALNNRLWFSYDAIQKYGISLFGNAIAVSVGANVDKYFYLDIGFIYYLMNFGIVGVVGYISSIIYIAKNSMKRGDSVVFIWCSIVAVESMVGRTYDSIWRNPLIFCLMYYLTENIKSKKRNKHNKIERT